MANSKKSPDRKRIIMVVDDEPDIRDTVKRLLENNGYDVITATDADDCLEKLKKSKPDLVLMDVMMPGTPVSKAVPKIKTKVAYLSVVRISEAEKEDLLTSKNVVGFIQKPFDIGVLLKKVRELSGA